MDLHSISELISIESPLTREPATSPDIHIYRPKQTQLGTLFATSEYLVVRFLIEIRFHQISQALHSGETGYPIL